MHTAAIAMPMPTWADIRRGLAVNWPAVLVFCAFVLTVEAILVIGWYQRQLALIPEVGRANLDPDAGIPAIDLNPRPRETPETLP